jgi:hypothetical protein
MNDNEESERDTVGEPTDTLVAHLVDELTDSLDGAVIYVTQQMRDHDTTFALWEGQTDDGRQWDAVLGKDGAFPWDGAADARVFYADGLIGEQVRICKAAWRRGQVQASALRMGDNNAGMDRAQSVTTLLRWLLWTHLRLQSSRRVALVARWRQQYGYALTGIGWRQDVRVRMEKLNLQKMTAAAQATAQQGGDRRLLDAVAAIMDPARDELALAMIRTMSPLVTKRAATKILRDLRTKGTAEVPQQEVVASLPRVRALRPFVDVFFPSNTDSIQNARFVAERAWLHEAEFRNLAAQNGWDEDWVERVLEEGKGKSFDERARAGVMQSAGEKVNRTWWQDPEEMEHLVEIVWHYERGTHEDYDLPCMYLTVYCPAVSGVDPNKGPNRGYHGPAPEKHGMYPYVEHVREAVDAAIAESRGVPQVAKGWQAELKTQRDAFINRSGIDTLPPLITTETLGRTRMEFGPGVQHTMRKGGEMKWLALPQSGSTAKVVAEQTEREADRYFGRYSEHVPDVAQQLATEDLAGDFLAEEGEVLKHVLALAQQYLSPMAISVVTGQPPVEISREEIQGMFDLTLTCDPRELNFELTIKKLEALQKFVLAADRVGGVDIHEYLQLAARAIDLDWSRKLIHAPEQAQENQVNLAKGAWTQMVAGVEPAMLPEGQDYGLQLQVLKNLMQNPENQKRLQQPDTQMLFERYVKHLQFGLQQQENADTGRNGVPPLDWRELQQPGMTQG